MKNNHSLLVLGTEKTHKLLIKYATPSIIAMIATSVYAITDSIFIGQGVGALALSGLAVTFPIMNLGAAFGTLVGIGAATLLSLKIGEKDYKTANHILGNVLVLQLITGLVLTLFILPFLGSLLRFFGASQDILPYAYDFMKVVLTGNFISHLYFGLNSLLRSAGHPQKAMTAVIFSVLINIILNPLFIFSLHWGIQGSAFATLISQSVVLCWQLLLFQDKNQSIYWQKGIYRLNKKIVFDLLSIGLAPFAMNIGSCLIIIVTNKQLMSYGGDLTIGAYGVVYRISFLFVMTTIGITQGMQPIVGYNYGAKKYERVLSVLKQAVFYATIVMSVGFLTMELFPKQVVSLFTNEPHLKDLAVVGLRLVFALSPFVGFQMVGSTFFQMIGNAKKSIILSLTRQIIFLIPLLLILPFYWSISGIWASICLSDGLSALMVGIFLYKEIKVLRRLFLYNS